MTEMYSTCSGKNCKLKAVCVRHMIYSSTEFQSVIAPEYDEQTKECPNFLENIPF